jgi:uncharacterized protein
MPTDLGWTALEWTGMEHVIASCDAAGFRADGQVIMAHKDLARKDLARISYQLECDPGWRLARLAIRITSAGSDRTLALSADGKGHWQADGQPVPALDGCLDVDIECTPLTNTLPVRRLGWLPGTPQDLDVVYVSIPELTVRPARQRYTLLERDPEQDEARYRYESGSFRADLRVDGDGFVIDYPGCWSRVGDGARDGSAASA